MGRVRSFSDTERQWVNEIIRDLCRQHNLRPGDEIYGSAAWEAFWTVYRRCRQAILKEKRARDLQFYGLLSLDAPLGPSEAVLLDLLPVQGDFTNGVAFWDFLFRLPEAPGLLARRLEQGDTMEEARSALGWDEAQLVASAQTLRQLMEEYERL